MLGRFDLLVVPVIISTFLSDLILSGKACGKQPVTTIIEFGLMSLNLCIDCLAFLSPIDVTVHEFIIYTSAKSELFTIVHPFSKNKFFNVSVSYWLTLQPSVKKDIFTNFTPNNFYVFAKNYKILIIKIFIYLICG